MKKTINARLVQLHNTQAIWENSYSEFIPHAGEIVVYDPDANYALPRFKLGDGSTTLRELPFYASNSDTDLSGAIKWEGDLGFIDAGEISSYTILEDN